MSTTEAGTSNGVLDACEFGFVDMSTRSSVVTAYLAPNDLPARELPGLRDALKKDLRFVEHVGIEVDDEIRVTLALKALDRDAYYREYLNDERRAQLLELLDPACVRKVSADATVVRDRNTAKHTQTRVTLRLQAGDDFSEVVVKELEGKHGVLRARRDGTHAIVFTMSRPEAPVSTPAAS